MADIICFFFPSSFKLISLLMHTFNVKHIINGKMRGAEKKLKLKNYINKIIKCEQVKQNRVWKMRGAWCARVMGFFLPVEYLGFRLRSFFQGLFNDIRIHPFKSIYMFLFSGCLGLPTEVHFCPGSDLNLDSNASTALSFGDPGNRHTWEPFCDLFWCLVNHSNTLGGTRRL